MAYAENYLVMSGMSKIIYLVWKANRVFKMVRWLRFFILLHEKSDLESAI